MPTKIFDESIDKYKRMLRERYLLEDGPLFDFLILTYSTKTQKLFDAREEILKLEAQLLIHEKNELYGPRRNKMVPIGNRTTSIHYQRFKSATTFTFSALDGLLLVILSTRHTDVVHDACKQLADAIIKYDKFEPVCYTGTLHFNSTGGFWVTLTSDDGLDIHKIQIETGNIPFDVQLDYFRG